LDVPPVLENTMRTAVLAGDCRDPKQRVRFHLVAALGFAERYTRNHRKIMTAHPHKNGFSLIELLIVVAIILVIAAIAIPSLIRSKMAANESSAVGTLRTINTASVSYASSYGVGYPAALSDLAPSTSPSSTAADLVDAVVVTGIKSGYTFSYAPGAAGASGEILTYSITADPIAPGSSGQRGFFTDQSLVIRVNATGTASSTDPPI
jgi:type IV pilus assembly protein PilA